MKTRVLYTSIWRDGWMASLPQAAKMLYIYLVTNDGVNNIFLYEMPAGEISHFTGIDLEVVQEWLATFEDRGKIKRYKDYIQLTNAPKYEKYKGWKNATSKMRSVELLSDDVLCSYSEYILWIMDEIKAEVRSSNQDAYSQVLDTIEAVSRRLRLCRKTAPGASQEPEVAASTTLVPVEAPGPKKWQDLTPSQQMLSIVSGDACDFGDKILDARYRTTEWLMITYQITQDIADRELDKFISYWTEPTKSGKKQRWQTEKTFEVRRRLSTWMGNFEKYTKDGSSKYKAALV